MWSNIDCELIGIGGWQEDFDASLSTPGLTNCENHLWWRRLEALSFNYQASSAHVPGSIGWGNDALGKNYSVAIKMNSVGHGIVLTLYCFWLHEFMNIEYMAGNCSSVKSQSPGCTQCVIVHQTVAQGRVWVNYCRTGNLLSSQSLHWAAAVALCSPNCSSRCNAWRFIAKCTYWHKLWRTHSERGV